MPPDLIERGDLRRVNPSGLPDGHAAKVAQPVPEHHHEEGHICDCPVAEQPAEGQVSE